jgi:hypothetical protein
VLRLPTTVRCVLKGSAFFQIAIALINMVILRGVCRASQQGRAGGTYGDQTADVPLEGGVIGEGIPASLAITLNDLSCSKRMFEKPHIGARRLSIRRVAAMSMRVSEVCTLYS